MATSSTYVISTDARTVFSDILRLVGVLGIGMTARPEDLGIVRTCFNDWILQQNGPRNKYRTGDMMWTNESATLTLSTSTNEYDLKPSGGDLDIQIPSEIISIVYRDSSDNDTPLISMTKREKDFISDKDASGTPSRYFYEKRLSEGKLYTDYVPSSADSLIIEYKQPLEIISAYNDEFDIDPSWYRFIKPMIGMDVCPYFEIESNTPKFQTLSMMAAQAMDTINSFFPNNQPIQMSP